MRKTHYALSVFALSFFCWHAASAQTPAATPSPTPDEKSQTPDDRSNSSGDKHGVVLHAPSVSFSAPMHCSNFVRLHAIFNKSGMVTNITVLKAVIDKPAKKDKDTLIKSSIEAAQQIKFTPAIKDGHPVSQYVTLEYCFDIYDSPDSKDEGHSSPAKDSKHDSAKPERQ
jgi:hypothetical protein